jgi:hypothetical protein
MRKLEMVHGNRMWDGSRKNTLVYNKRNTLIKGSIENASFKGM